MMVRNLTLTGSYTESEYGKYGTNFTLLFLTV